MGEWNHRVMKKPSGIVIDGVEEPYYEIVEVFYDDLGRPQMYGDATPSAESMAGLVEYVEWLEGATKLPVLTPDDFVGPGED